MNTLVKKYIYHPLKWVKPELAATIKSIHLSLQAYTETEKNDAIFSNISNDLYLLRGSLEMLEFYGIALLAEGMQNAVSALLGENTTKKDDVFESLLQATLSLESYIDQLQQNDTGLPLPLLPAMNDIRAALNEPLLSESALFLPNLSIVPKAPSNTPADINETCLTDSAISLRPYYQAALLTWFRDPNDLLSMQQMKLVARNLESSSQTPRNRQIWWIMGGLYEALLDKGLETNISLKLLLAQADRILKSLAQDNDTHFEKRPPVDLLKNALYYVSQSTSNGKRVQLLKRIYSLNDVIPCEQDSAAHQNNSIAPSSASFQAITAELKKTLTQVKATIDNFSRNTPDDTDKLNQTIIPLKHISDTLSLLSMGNERKILQNLIERLSDIISAGTKPDRETMFKVASAMLHIESTLKNTDAFNYALNHTNHAASHNKKEHNAQNQTFDDHQLVVKVAEEASHNLTEIKNFVLAQLSENSLYKKIEKKPENSSEINAIKHIPHLLSEVIGSMLILKNHALSEVLTALLQYAHNDLINNTAINKEIEYDIFAEAIINIEYYLETMAEQSSSNDAILETTAEKLAHLGYSVNYPKKNGATTENNTTATQIINTPSHQKPNTLALVQKEFDEPTPSSDEESIRVRNIFVNEAFEELAKMDPYIQSLQLSPSDIDTLSAIHEIYHTLKGSGKVAGAVQTGIISTAADDYLVRVLYKSIQIEQQGVTLLTDAFDLLSDSITLFEESDSDTESAQEFKKRVSGFIEEQILKNAKNNQAKPTKVFGSITTDKTDLSLSLVDDAEQLFEKPPEPLADLFAKKGIKENISDNTKSNIKYFFKESTKESNEKDSEKDNEKNIEEDITPIFGTQNFIPSENEDTEADNDFDLIDIFIEEARELIEKGQQTISDTETFDDSFFSSMQRILHTMKGCARMAGVTPVGNVAHSLESVFESIIATKTPASAELIYQLTQETLDAISDMIEDIQSGADLRTFADLLSKLEATSKTPEILEDNNKKILATQLSSSESASSKPVSLDSIASEPVAPETSPTYSTNYPPASSASSQETSPTAKANYTSDPIKVDPAVLDKLVDFATEESAISSRIDENVSASKTSLSELDKAISRTLTQMRDLQFESNISRGTQNRFNDDNLNLSSFSESQKVAQRLMESIGDIESLHSTLMRLTLETDNLVHQQQKIHGQLHEKLLNTRMVTFSVQTQRMQRVLRQTCNELNKKAKLKLEGTDGEIDRSVLDVIMGPLEHIIRNAIAHGIEKPREREKNNKKKFGTITISFSKDKSEHLITISDDGAGLNLDNIRQKAIEKNVINEDQEISDDEIANLVFESGLSTNNKVSQISGRGVGMDVVLTTIQELGGTVSISTVKEKGSTFTLRLPFTLSRNHTLIIQSGSNTYAIPSYFIESTFQVSLEELKTLYQSDPPSYTFYDSEYPLWYADTLLNDAATSLPTTTGHAHIILIKCGQKRIALHIDNIIEKRDVVLKPNSAQLGNVAGIAGATVMGDGKVVLIIDISTLTKLANRAKQSKREISFTNDSIKNNNQITTLVVDDSITVRKVTKRFLSRNGINALLASDGIDALKTLEKEVPDIMLVDIEMPGMDGLELARTIKATSHLQHIPIIMITSRTGKQHRNAANNIGIDVFLGKPYHESELLQHIQALTGKEPAGNLL